ncbi:MAG: 5'-methylthioadenosine/adenosylhomocysteine nucleosidase [Proteobacteria bacterium]|nr:5'-methylthioadenosine/adenosylhomocysteine nucleosidase [Pseudomonadota bacterium]
MARTAILSALAQEQQGLLHDLRHARRVQHAGREFWLGELAGQPVVLALSRVGKVAAATTATALIERFAAQRLLFVGVAGALAPRLAVGDVVVADGFVQHDLDASPLFPRYELPLYGRSRIACDAPLSELLHRAAQAALAGLGSEGAAPALHRGLVASGDRFVSGFAEAGALRHALLDAGHDALAVEMEGAAVAQVCLDYGRPFVAVRTISDRADDQAHVDFTEFIEQVARRHAHDIVRAWLSQLP